MKTYIRELNMILIQQLYVDDDIKSDFVKCPSCRKGRLCDKAVGEKATALSVSIDEKISKNKASIILKCPKCAARFLVHVGLED